MRRCVDLRTFKKRWFHRWDHVEYRGGYGDLSEVMVCKHCGVRLLRRITP